MKGLSIPSLCFSVAGSTGLLAHADILAKGTRMPLPNIEFAAPRGEPHALNLQPAQAPDRNVGPGSGLREDLRKLALEMPFLSLSSILADRPLRPMCLFVLRHARQLLRSTDSETVLQCEQLRGDFEPLESPYWCIAAAELQPDRAPMLLREAWARYGAFSQRGDLSLALWRLIGPKEASSIADWFYSFNPVPERGAVSHSQALFLERLGSEKGTYVRSLVASLMRDERFSKLGWQSLRQLGTLVNSWTQSPVISVEEIHAAQHPMGMSHYESGTTEGPSEAARRHPTETRELESILANWRTRLRQSMSEWASQPE